MPDPGDYRLGAECVDWRTGTLLENYVLLSESSTVHKTLTDMTEQVTCALQTKRARNGLKRIAEGWAKAHAPNLSPAEDAKEFQLLLHSTIAHRSRWPILMVEWLLPADHMVMTIGDCKYNLRSTTFSLPDQVILLNGIRFSLLLRDMRHDNPEWHVRWLELFVAYCHEIGQLFVIFLSFKHRQNVRHRTPSNVSLAYMEKKDVYGNPFPPEVEAGTVLEDSLFGGVYLRISDNSGWNKGAMTGVPALLTDKGTVGIHLESVLRLTCSPTLEGRDLRLETFPTEASNDPEKRFSDFYLEFANENHKLRFGRRLDKSPDLSAFQPVWLNAFSHRPVRPRYTSASMQRGCARPVYIGEENIIYVYNTSKRSSQIIVGYRPPQGESLPSRSDYRSSRYDDHRVERPKQLRPEIITIQPRQNRSDDSTSTRDGDLRITRPRDFKLNKDDDPRTNELRDPKANKYSGSRPTKSDESKDERYNVLRPRKDDNWRSAQQVVVINEDQAGGPDDRKDKRYNALRPRKDDNWRSAQQVVVLNEDEAGGPDDRKDKRDNVLRPRKDDNWRSAQQVVVLNEDEAGGPDDRKDKRDNVLRPRKEDNGRSAKQAVVINEDQAGGPDDRKDKRYNPLRSIKTTIGGLLNK